MAQQTKLHTIGFILEQSLGHITHSNNLQHHMAMETDVRPLWGLIPWETEGVAARVPGYRSNWTIRAGLRARRSLAKMQRQAELDALFIHTQVPAVLLADRFSSIPTVVSLDATPLQYDSLGEHYGHDRSAGWLEFLKKQLNQHCFHRARHLVCWSIWTAESLIDDYGIQSNKISVIPPGVDAEAWQRPDEQATDDDAVRILFVGGNLRRKGGHLLLDAFRLLRKEFRNAGEHIRLELHLVTRSDVVEEPGVLVYRDLQPNSVALKSLFHTCDIFCLPTLGDCLPLVLAEAGAAGLPSIATNVGAIDEIVNDGITGLLVAPGRLDELVASLRQLILNPELRLRLGENAQKLIHSQHDSRRNTARLLRLLAQTADEARVEQTSEVSGRNIWIGHKHG